MSSRNNNSTIEKSVKIIDGFLKHDEDPCIHTFAQILDSIFDDKNKSPDTTQPSFVSDATQPPVRQVDEIV